MTYDHHRHYRQSIRLKEYDYSQSGAYFVTICSKDRACLFGEIVDGEMLLNETGQMVRNMWNDLDDRYPDIETDEFVVMPNHLHGIIVIVGAQFIAPVETVTPSDCNAINHKKQGVINHAPTVGNIVRAFKARCTHAINKIRDTPGIPVWQRNYYDHIIRGEQEMNRIRGYIIENPAKWIEDKDNPENIIHQGGETPPLR